MGRAQEVQVQYYKGSKISLLLTSGDFKAESGWYTEPIKAQTLPAIRAKIDATILEGPLEKEFAAYVVDAQFWQLPKPVTVIGLRKTQNHGPMLVYRDAEGKEGLTTDLVLPSAEFIAGLERLVAAKEKAAQADAVVGTEKASLETLRQQLRFGALDAREIAAGKIRAAT